jgi:hypothetical protein
MLRRHWLHVVAVIGLAVGLATTLWLWSRVGLIAGGECPSPPPGQTCHRLGNPYVLQGFLVLAVTLIGAAILWGQGSIRAQSEFPPSAKEPRVNSRLARD